MSVKDAETEFSQVLVYRRICRYMQKLLRFIDMCHLEPSTRWPCISVGGQNRVFTYLGQTHYDNLR